SLSRLEFLLETIVDHGLALPVRDAYRGQISSLAIAASASCRSGSVSTETLVYGDSIARTRIPCSIARRNSIDSAISSGIGASCSKSRRNFFRNGRIATCFRRGPTRFLVLDGIGLRDMKSI